jgi:hypothetical protein
VPRDDFRRQAAAVRAIPLEVVLTSWGAKRDRHDKSRWHTPRGPLSVSGTKFFNWQACQGGGGAIDLGMHLGGWDARQAIEWLAHHLSHHVAGVTPTVGADPTIATSAEAESVSRLDSPSGFAPSSHGSASPEHRPLGPPAPLGARPQLHLPTASPAQLPRVRRYLIQQRGLSAAILASLIDQGKLYADARGNAVFVMLAGKPNRPIGAELRGPRRRGALRQTHEGLRGRQVGLRIVRRYETAFGGRRGSGFDRHHVSTRPDAALRCPSREVRRRSGRRPTADPALPRTVCDAGTLMEKGTFSATCGILA